MTLFLVILDFSFVFLTTTVTLLGNKSVAVRFCDFIPTSVVFHFYKTLISARLGSHFVWTLCFFCSRICLTLRNRTWTLDQLSRIFQTNLGGLVLNVPGQCCSRMMVMTCV